MKFKKIMLIDDDVDDREIFCLILKDVSPETECITYSYGRDALQYLQNADDLPEAVFVDLNMPLMDGKQFLTEIKKLEKLRNIPVYVYSTAAHYERVDNTTELGAAGFLKKSAQFKELENTLKRILE